VPSPATSAKVIGSIFAVSGVVHLVRPEVYEPLIPGWLPGAREIVYGSGVAELLCAAGLAHPRTRRLAGWASAAVLVGVFPGNVQMAVDAMGTDNTALKVGSLARLPLQAPLVWLAVRAARGSRPGIGSAEVGTHP
jgi:uncharacterized membrane protein